MASSAVTLSAARKLSAVRGAWWIDGPVCRPDERKVWEIELADLLELVAAVERAAPSTTVAAQWLRRMFYGRIYGGAGPLFDTFIETDVARLTRPVTTADGVPQSVLDALIRVGTVRIPGATPPFDRVEISHVFVLLDLRLHGASLKGTAFDGVSGDLLQPILSWGGDIGSAWLGYQKEYEAAKTAAGAGWSEPLTPPSALVTPLGWLEDGIRERSPIDDLLGDLDAVVLAAQPLPAGSTPIATLLETYYTPGVSSTATVARMADRFALWATRVRPAIPHTVGTGGAVTLDPAARDWLRMAAVTPCTAWLLLAARSRSKGGGIDLSQAVLQLVPVNLELNGPWHNAMLEALSDRFHTFLADGLAGRPLTWPAQTPGAVAYPGYEWTPGPGPLAPPGLTDIDDLATAGQFFVSWRQPHRPLRSTDRLLRRVRLADPAGPTATLLPGTTTLRLDPFSGLAGVRPAPATGDHADLLRLEADAARPGKTYRIVAVDPAANTVTVDGTPAIGTGSPWRILRRPRLVLVDPFGARLLGSAANTLGLPAGWVSLDGLPDLATVRANFDTIALDGGGRISRSYRVLEVHQTQPQVRVDDTVTLLASTWRIPAAFAAAHNPLATALTPRTDGCDLYDGLLFVVYDNAIQGPPVPFTSYASAANATSSISGNTVYTVRSLRSPDSSARNYEFAVTDPGAETTDLVAAAGYYQDGVTALRTPPAPGTSTARVDADGKTAIRIHIGNATGSVSGSTGDLVSPGYRSLRTVLIGLHQAERALLGLAADADLAAVAAAATQAQSIALYEADTVTWDDRLHCELILLRPDLRPTI